MQATQGQDNYGSLRIINEDDDEVVDDDELPSPKRLSGLRNQLDSWLRQDHSVRGGWGSGSISSLSSAGGRNDQLSLLSSAGGRNDSSRSSVIFGPTDRSVESRVQDQNRAGLQYKSVDRGLVDTTVWHKRKVALLGRRRKKKKKATHKAVGSDASALSKISWQDSFAEDEGDGYKFDAKAVSRLQTERWLFDQVLVAGIGVLMACTGLAVSKTADKILDKKLETALDRFEERGFMEGMVFHVGISTLLAFFAFLPVWFRPVSAGSGIAEAKATLNGVIIPNCTSLLTALCKGLSVIMSVSASLPAGLEGPMIHLGLCIGENANRVVPRKYEVLDPLRTDRSRIDYTAIGTAAGVSAAFRAPISGILFAMEEGASYWSTNLTWRCFLSACVTVIAMYGIISATQTTFHITSMDLFNGIEQGLKHADAVVPAGFVPKFQLWEYGLFILVGVGGGLIGAIFCMANRAIAVARRRAAFGMTLKGLEVLFIATIYASLIWVLPSLPFLSRCGNIADRRMGGDYFRQFDCPEGHYNELATLLLNIGGKGITLLFQEDGASAFSITTCVAAGLVQVVTLCIAFGISVSAGIFIPLLFIGACFGRAFALAVGLDPRTYAIVGAAACLGGVVRVLISLTAIVTSTTSLSFFITPIMLATLFAQTIGNWVSGRPGIYDVILQLRDVPFLEEECPEGARHANIRARNIMKTGLITVGTQMKVADLREKLRRHDFSEFPVVDRDANGNGTGALVGLISRVDLIALLSRSDIFFTDEEQRVGANDSSVEEKTLSFADLDRARPTLPLPVKEEIGKALTPDDERKYLHVSPYIQMAPHTFDGHGSAERAYEMFRCLGLRSLLVVDKQFRPIGVITRHELILLEEIGHEHHKIVRKIEQTSIYLTKQSDMMNQFE